MGLYKPRFGLSSKEVNCFAEKWYKLDGAENWPNLDSFILWSLENGFKNGFHIKKKHPDQKHSPENSYFVDLIAEKEKRDKVREQKKLERAMELERKKLELSAERSEFCRQCVEDCQSIAYGCLRWREYFVSNWNKNICQKRAEPEEKPVRGSEGPQVFLYEHPDLVREGIVFMGGAAVDQ